MRSAFRHILAVLLVLAQLALGPAGGGTVCLGQPGAPEAEAAHCCGHGTPAVPHPAPAVPHDDGCPCLDVPSTVSHTFRIDLVRDTGLDILSPALVEPGSRAGMPRAVASAEPAGPVPRPRTTHLLL